MDFQGIIIIQYRHNKLDWLGNKALDQLRFLIMASDAKSQREDLKTIRAAQIFYKQLCPL